MNYQTLETQLLNDEGYESYPYMDTVGVWTIGYGTTRILGKPVTQETPPLTPKIARQLLRSDLYGALVDTQDVIGVQHFEQFNNTRQAVLVNMMYNLGKSRFCGFRLMLAALHNFDFTEAANQMWDSKWYSQTGKRSQRLVREMRSGTAHG